jgi:chemotaxis protein MotB
MRRNLGLAVVMLALIACVPKKKYDESLAENARLSGEVDGLKTTVGSLSSEMDRLKGDLRSSEQALSEAQNRLASQTAQAGQLKEDLVKMQQALSELERRKAQADATLAQFRDLLARFKSLIDSGTLKVKIVNGRMVVELATDILFPAGSASLSKAGKEAIASVAKVLADIPGREYQVVGHTDNVPIANAQFPSNWYLGASRAIAVTDLLVANGLPPERVSAASSGDTKPAETNRTPEGRKINRRIEIVIVPDLSQLPGYSELQALGNEKAAPMAPAVP